MPKFLWKASYTVEGTRGIAKEGGSSRRAAVEQVVKGLGGSIDGFYYAFGDSDVYVIADLPDSVAAAAVSLKINASGAVALTTVPLLTPEEIDEAAQKSVDYRPPGT